MQACSDLAHVVLVLVRRVTVVIVHIGLDGVLVIVHFCVAILFVNCCIRRCSLYRKSQRAVMGRAVRITHVALHTSICTFILPRRRTEGRTGGDQY